jgi:hypothetical protein
MMIIYYQGGPEQIVGSAHSGPAARCISGSLYKRLAK